MHTFERKDSFKKQVAILVIKPWASKIIHLNYKKLWNLVFSVKTEEINPCLFKISY
jgi:hypothetical protein